MDGVNFLVEMSSLRRDESLMMGVIVWSCNRQGAGQIMVSRWSLY